MNTQTGSKIRELTLDMMDLVNGGAGRASAACPSCKRPVNPASVRSSVPCPYCGKPLPSSPSGPAAENK